MEQLFLYKYKICNPVGNKTNERICNSRFIWIPKLCKRPKCSSSAPTESITRLQGMRNTSKGMSKGMSNTVLNISSLWRWPSQGAVEIRLSVSFSKKNIAKTFIIEDDRWNHSLHTVTSLTLDDHCEQGSRQHCMPPSKTDSFLERVKHDVISKL